MKRTCMVGSLWLAGWCASVGNGGGYFRSGNDTSGDIAGFEPKAVENVRILDEKITALVGPESTDVEVRYVMRNTTDHKVKVRFGFPVEESVVTDPAVPAETKPKPGSDAPSSISAYRVEAAGKALGVKWQREASKPKADPRFKSLSGWMISEMAFSASEEKVVGIHYTVVHDAGAFVYRLSTGACWAGTIGSGRIVIRPNGVDPRNLIAARPVNRFKRSGDDWVWDFDNLEPTLNDDLRIESNFRDETIHDDVNPNLFRRYGKQWTIEEKHFKVTASSVLPPEGDQHFDPSNLEGGTGVWAEGQPGPGIGEWLEIRPEIVKPVRSITLLPGFQSSEALFKANARPKRVKVVLNDSHSFSVEIPDRRSACVIPVRNYDKAVEKIRLVFEEVWPGAKFEDLCVSGIRLELRLDKKPKINPYR